MKKLVALFLVLLLALGFAACGKKAQSYDLILATGGTGGSYYPYGGAMAQLFIDKVEGVTATATSTGASAENARLLNSSEADLAILQNDVLDYAFNGTETMKEGGALKNLATIATLYPEPIQIVATVASGITSVEDMKGKRVSVGAAGSGTEANARQILEAFGMTYDDIDESFLSFAESSTGMQNMTLDAAFVTAGIPNPAIMELSAMTEVVLVTIPDEKVAALVEKYPFYSSLQVPDDAYEAMNGGQTVTVLATLACRADLDEDLVYNLTKALFDNQTELAQANAKAADLKLETAVKGASVAFHPGAEKYYKEVGAIG